MTANIGNVTEEKKINAEQKTGEATIINHFGSKFNSLEIRHRLGNDSKYEQKAIFTNIDDGKMVGPFKFTTMGARRVTNAQTFKSGMK